jgi:hypothetical protein
VSVAHREVLVFVEEVDEGRGDRHKLVVPATQGGRERRKREIARERACVGEKRK